MDPIGSIGVVVLLVVAGVGFFLRRYARRVALARLRESRRACRLLLSLISHLQQHRGMSSAWLAGDAGFGAKRQEKAGQIEVLFVELMAVARAEAGMAHPCFTGNDANLFRFNWRSLLDELAGLTPEVSLLRHNALINQVLTWLAAIGEARLMPLATDAMQRQWVRNASISLPALAECLGQARALGAGVAARGVCSPVARVRLLFLANRAQSLMQQANQGGDGHASQMLVAQMTQVIRNGLLAYRVEVEAGAYFALATRTIDSVFDWADQSNRRLADLVEQSQPVTGDDWSRA